MTKVSLVCGALRRKSSDVISIVAIVIQLTLIPRLDIFPRISTDRKLVPGVLESGFLVGGPTVRDSQVQGCPINGFAVAWQA